MLTLSGVTTIANYQAALAQVRFTVQGDNPTNFGAATTRTIGFSLFDGLLYSDEVNIQVNVVNTNDAPTFTGLGGDSVTTTEPAGGGSTLPAVRIDAGANAAIGADVDGQNYAGGSIRFAITAGAATVQDQLTFDTNGTGVTTAGNTVSVGGTAIGTFAGGGSGAGDLVVTFNANATAALVQSLVRAVQFTNTGGDNPTAGARTITTTFNDGGGTGGSSTNPVVVTSTVNVVAVDDAPVATIDFGTTTETSSVTIAPLANDIDLDGGAIDYALINGVNLAVGNSTTLASGAIVTRNADGTLGYNPNGQSNYLITTTQATAAGASNSSATDVFTYQLTPGSSSSTVTVTVNGVQGAGDELRGTPGVDNLTGTAGADIIRALASNDFVLGNDGDDNIDAGDGDDTVRAGNGNDTVLGGLGRDLISGGDGNDTLDGGTGLANELGGGIGDDLFIVGAVGDTILEGVNEGTDTVQTALGLFALPANVENLTYTGAGAFIGIGNGLDNTITHLTGSAGELQGGAGNDNYVIGVAGDTVVEAANGGVDFVQTALARFTLAANVEVLNYTGTASFTGVGNAGDNTISGGTAADVLIGGGGNDVIAGGSGAANELYGGTGNDTYVVTVAGDTITEAAGEGADSVQTALANYTLAANVENLTYTGAATAFNGVGNAGDNAIIGGGAADILSGLNGNDVLTGGSGADLLIGGAGNDTFRYLGGETGLDRIIDFTAGSDRILLAAAGFTQTGTLTFQTGTAATTANSTFLYDTNSGIVSYDADGSGAGAAIQLAQLNTGLTLTIADFVIA